MRYYAITIIACYYFLLLVTTSFSLNDSTLLCVLSQLFAQFFALFDCIIIWSFLADEAFTV